MTPFDDVRRSEMSAAGACAVGQAAQASDPTRVTTDVVTLMYPYLLAPTTYQGRGTPYYRCCLGVRNEDRATIDRLFDGVRAAIARGARDNMIYGIPLPNGIVDDDVIKSFRLTIHSGEMEYPGDKRFAPYILANCKTYQRPAVVDANCQPVTDPDAVRHGMMCRATVSFRTYNYMGTRGVSCTLHHVQILE